VLGLLIGGAAATAFAVISSARYTSEGSSRSPALELDLYRNRRFALAGIGSGLFGAALYTWLLVSPLFLAEYWHYSILKVGLAITPGAFTSAIAAIAVGRRVKPQGQSAAVLFGATVFGIVCAVMAGTLGHQPKFLEIWLWVSLFGGLGIGAALTGLTTISSTAVPPLRFSAGTGLTITARQLGGSLGVAVMAVLLSTTTGDPLKNSLHVYWFCAAASLAAVVIGVALRFAPPPAVAAHQPPPTAPRAAPTAESASS
jgi:MFS family permease